MCLMKTNVDESIVIIVYAPQMGLDELLKVVFYDELQFTVTKLSGSEYLYLCGDFNGHIGQKAARCAWWLWLWGIMQPRG